MSWATSSLEPALRPGVRIRPRAHRRGSIRATRCEGRPQAQERAHPDHGYWPGAWAETTSVSPYLFKQVRFVFADTEFLEGVRTESSVVTTVNMRKFTGQVRATRSDPEPWALEQAPA